MRRSSRSAGGISAFAAARSGSVSANVEPCGVVEFEFEPAAHPLSQPPRDRKAKARATGFARCGLGEFLEDEPGALWRDSGAGIADDEFELRGLARDAQADAAVRGKLHRIADEIEQHLPQPRRIADDPRRDICANEARDVEAPRMGAGREDFDRALDQQGKVERRFGERNLAGLEFARSRISSTRPARLLPELRIAST